MVYLFDLDGTLLPMDQERFTECYFSMLVQKAAPYGYGAKELISAVWAGTKAMVLNDGAKSNCDVFWQTFSDIFGKDSLKDRSIFDDFYANEFENAKSACGFQPKAAEAIAYLKNRRERVALATNPIFPSVATSARIRWAGLCEENFELVTTYENSSFAKPNPDYYLSVCKSLGVSPKHCVMVGNDVEEDMVASSLGMEVFLLTDCLINRRGADLSAYPCGNFDDLLAWLKEHKTD